MLIFMIDNIINANFKMKIHRLTCVENINAVWQLAE